MNRYGIGATMIKRLSILLATAAVGGLLAAGTASAAGTVPIVMHDPGCHFFNVNGKLLSKLTVSGKTTFRNLDEAALVFKGTSFAKKLAVGKTLALTRGTYHITMVGQAADDNHLLLVIK
jgi:hypothetical protein